jgi:hypothetical protein
MKLTLAESGLVPECQFYAIAHPDLVVDYSKIVANDLLGNSQLLSYFPIL